MQGDQDSQNQQQEPLENKTEDVDFSNLLTGPIIARKQENKKWPIIGIIVLTFILLAGVACAIYLFR